LPEGKRCVFTPHAEQRLAKFNIKFTSSNGNVSLFIIPKYSCDGSIKGYIPELSLINVQSFDGTLSGYPPEYEPYIVDPRYCYFFRSENWWQPCFAGSCRRQVTNITIDRFHFAGEYFSDPEAEQKYAILSLEDRVRSPDGEISFQGGDCRRIEGYADGRKVVYGGECGRFDQHYRPYSWSPFVWTWYDYKPLFVSLGIMSSE